MYSCAVKPILAEMNKHVNGFLVIHTNESLISRLYRFDLIFSCVKGEIHTFFHKKTRFFAGFYEYTLPNSYRYFYWVDR